MKKINYIAEINLPSKSAYSIQVMKMCDAFSLEGYSTKLFIFGKKGKKIHKYYNCKKKFKIKDLKINSNIFLNRLLFAFKILVESLNSNNKEIFYSRSIITALILAYKNKNIILEIHHELKGFSGVIFNLSRKFNFFKNLKIVFISKNLKKFFKLNNKSIILDDGVDLDAFVKINKSIKKIQNTCVYTGSFAKGKGIETIIKVSKLLPKIKFHLYGDFSNSEYDFNDLRNYENIIYKGFVQYKMIPNILKKYHLYLMPYSEKVYVRSRNIEVGKYMSPMKLFEYMASDGVIFASKMDVYSHILNKNNSILISNKSINKWKQEIETFFEKKSKYNFISQNALEGVKKFTWKNRVKKLEKFLNA